MYVRAECLAGVGGDQCQDEQTIAFTQSSRSIRRQLYVKVAGPVDGKWAHRAQVGL
jgi:hypothetical protein